MSGTPLPAAVAAGGPGLMRTDTVTLYNALPEIDRHVAYRRTVLRGVRADETSGAVATMQGRTSTDGLMLFIPGNTPGYVDPETFVETAEDSDYGVPAEGYGAWTLRDGDLIVVGECELDVPPASTVSVKAGRRSYKITGVEPAKGRRGRVHHWEAAGS